MGGIRDAGASAMLVACVLAARSSAGEAELVAIPVRRWKALGPLGHARMPERPDVRHPKWPAHNFVYKLYTSSSYPMDSVVDLDATYEGEITRDSKGRERALRWVTVTAAEKDHVESPGQKEMVEGVGLTYFSSWIESPERMAVPVRFPAYRGTARFGSSVKVWVNGREASRYKVHGDNPYIFHPREEQEITLRKGWNHVYSKHMSAFWGNRMAMTLRVDPGLAFDIAVAAEPPPEVGRRFDIAGRRLEPERGTREPAPPAAERRSTTARPVKTPPVPPRTKPPSPPPPETRRTSPGAPGPEATAGERPRRATAPAGTSSRATLPLVVALALCVAGAAAVVAYFGLRRSGGAGGHRRRARPRSARPPRREGRR